MWGVEIPLGLVVRGCVLSRLCRRCLPHFLVCKVETVFYLHPCSPVAEAWHILYTHRRLLRVLAFVVLSDQQPPFGKEGQKEGVGKSWRTGRIWKKVKILVHQFSLLVTGI